MKLRGEGWSNPRIADKLQIGETTVRRDLEAGSPNGEGGNLPPALIQGKDGKSYPAQRPRTIRVETPDEADEIKALMKRAASDIIEIGQKLIEVKARLGHGNFGAWLASEFDWSDRIARQFMAVGEQFGHVENGTIFRFGSSALRLLAAPSTPDSAREEAIERAGQGETITHSIART